jgi:hypothetical protein
MHAFSQQEEKVHGRRRSRGCSRGTHNSGGGWRRDCRSPNNVRLICSLFSIIYKLHVCLIVDDPLKVWSKYGILNPMVEHIHQLSPEKYVEAWRSLIIQYG